MINNILVISSDYTGHGHKSITEALCEEFSEYEDINITIVDGFSLGGKALLQIGKSYGTITRNVKELWNVIWKVSLANPKLINNAVELIIKDDFLRLLNKVKPDLIISLHPNFIGSVLNILEKNDMKIPFVTLIADLVSISPQWVDSRSDFIIVPTAEARLKCMQYRYPANKIKVLGFPVRKRFHNKRPDMLNKYSTYGMERPLECLIMSGGEGSGNMNKLAAILLDNFNCKVKIVAGRNASAKKRLENSLYKRYGNKVEIYGFVNNIQELMMTSDIAFTRGSPNVMMEAVSCNIPLVITGALPGQEKGNPEYAQKYKLGVVCYDIKNIQKTLDNLLSNNALKLNQIKKVQKHFADSNVAQNIVDLVLGINRDDAMFYDENKKIN
jgi:UDP-N-acetylglucosamine:LPS N-acetylglucosamine transferase